MMLTDLGYAILENEVFLKSLSYVSTPDKFNNRRIQAGMQQSSVIDCHDALAGFY